MFVAVVGDVLVGVVVVDDVIAVVIDVVIAVVIDVVDVVAAAAIGAFCEDFVEGLGDVGDVDDEVVCSDDEEEPGPTEPLESFNPGNNPTALFVPKENSEKVCVPIASIPTSSSSFFVFPPNIEREEKEKKRKKNHNFVCCFLKKQ